MKTTGRIHLYYGDGKGKTTAAIGLALRALGWGRRVLLVQFLKGNGSGERASLSIHPGFDALSVPDHIKFASQMGHGERKQAKQLCERLLREAEERCQSGAYDLLLLDEVCAAVSEGFLEESRVRGLMDRKPGALELVLTGRNPAPSMLQAADYVTEMKNVRHPYAGGLSAREGIEY